MFQDVDPRDNSTADHRIPFPIRPPARPWLPGQRRVPTRAAERHSHLPALVDASRTFGRGASGSDRGPVLPQSPVRPPAHGLIVRLSGVVGSPRAPAPRAPAPAASLRAPATRPGSASVTTRCMGSLLVRTGEAGASTGGRDDEHELDSHGIEPRVAGRLLRAPTEAGPRCPAVAGTQALLTSQYAIIRTWTRRGG
jgi:hypothetical protein